MRPVGTLTKPEVGCPSVSKILGSKYLAPKRTRFPNPSSLRESRAVFAISKKLARHIIGFKPIENEYAKNELVNVNIPTQEKDNCIKDQLYSHLEATKDIVSMTKQTTINVIMLKNLPSLGLILTLIHFPLCRKYR